MLTRATSGQLAGPSQNAMLGRTEGVTTPSAAHALVIPPRRELGRNQETNASRSRATRLASSDLPQKKSLRPARSVIFRWGLERSARSARKAAQRGGRFFRVPSDLDVSCTPLPFHDACADCPVPQWQASIGYEACLAEPGYTNKHGWPQVSSHLHARMPTVQGFLGCPCAHKRSVRLV